jgi:AmmeMemoRadiSam system protein A
MEFVLSDSEQKTLLKVARDTLEMWIRECKKPDLPEVEGNLLAETGAFVTLHKKGQLRGCIGNMVGQGPLVETIQNMAIAASTEDPRFNKMVEEELSDIDIEISVLSPMKRIKDTNDIEVGKHGILLGKGWNRGVLLPQVAIEYGWDRETFLRQTCLKAGLAPDDWKDPETIIEIFSAQIFSELYK